MKKKFKDRLSDFIIFLIRPIVNLALWNAMDVRSSGLVIKRNRKEPFIIISNHFNTWDSFVVMKNVKTPIRFVATEVAFLDFMKKISMGYLAQTIKKRVGKPDMRAVRKILDYINQGYAIGLYPEGDNTFYGETLDFYKSTGRLLKKANVDVFFVSQKGGYLSQPRWADVFTKRGVVYTNTKLLLSKEELSKLSSDEINDIVGKELHHNDYEWQREMMINYKRKHRALGIERLVYYCSNCNSVLTVSGNDNDIVCSNCGTIGTINEYEFIEGNKFDNLVDYNEFQYSHIEDVIKSTFTFDIKLNTIDFKKVKNNYIGKFTLIYKNKTLYLNNNDKEYVFELNKIKYPVNTMRHSFSFEYEDTYYNFTDIRHQFVLYEMCRYLNGSYKE